LERRLPEAWIAPAEVLEVRALTRLYVALMADHRAWQQRIQAQLFHQGVPAIASLLTADGAAALGQAELSPAGRQMVHTATTAMATLRSSLVPLRRQLEAIGPIRYAWSEPLGPDRAASQLVRSPPCALLELDRRPVAETRVKAPLIPFAMPR
jgi:hypothetical protein